MADTRLPPHDLDAEEAVNGSLLIDGKAIYEIATFLRSEDFYSPSNRSIYQACLNLYQRDEAINKITVSQELSRLGNLEKSGDLAYLSHLASIVPTSLEILHFARIVQRLSVMRQLILASDKIAEIGHGGEADPVTALNKAEDVLFRLRHKRGDADFVHIRDLLEQYFEAPPEATGGALPVKTSIHSGFTGLDELLGGFQRSDLVIVAGRPSMGKTSFALNIARNAAVLERACTAIFSLEMSQESLVSRLLSAESGVNAKRIRLGLYHDIHDEHEGRIMDAIGVLSEAPIYLDDSPQLRMVEMRSKARRLHYEHGLDLIIVDYLQLLQGDTRTDNRVQEIGYISRALKALARELNVPVIAVSQLSRAVEWRQSHVPVLSDLRESGSIEQDADVVAFVYREEVYYTEEEWYRTHEDQEYPRELADIIVAKHRNGPIGQVKLRFNSRITNFENLAADTVGLKGSEVLQ